MATKIRVTKAFLDRIKSTGLSDAALAAAIGVTPQFFSQVKNGHSAPSAGFMAGAVISGLAAGFSDVAEVVLQDEVAA